MTDTANGISRRRLLHAAGLVTAASMAGPVLAAAQQQPAASGKAFPKGFGWGVATSAYQLEGNNFASDIWLLEHVKPTIYAEPSGDAADHYHLYRDDIALAKGLGFNTWRLSIEWARIEPEPGAYSRAELEHYRRVLATCHEAGLSPMVSYNHFSLPRWAAAMGGWQNDAVGEAFVRYCARVDAHLGDLIDNASTFNEPNLPKVLRWHGVPRETPQAHAMLAAAAKASGSDRFIPASYGDLERMQAVMLKTHDRAYAALKGGRGRYPVGINMSMSDDQPVGEINRLAEKRADIYAPWLDAADRSDFIGLQTYTRTRVGKDGDLPNEDGVPITQLFYEYWPQALEPAVRYVAAHCKAPIWITENGVGTSDDALRVAYIRTALAGLQRCTADGIKVKGYLFWSLLDNFEFDMGYTPTFGLFSVDRETQKRTAKPSAAVLGDIARRNAL